MKIRLTVTALAVAAAFPAFSQSTVDIDEAVMATTVVTATRFESLQQTQPIATQVITAEQIRESSASTVSQVLSKLGGVHTRINFTGLPDTPIDLRGFGVTGDQNTLVLVNGQRISEYENATARISAIPVDSIERIEILRGSGAVLYGSGATGGVINIITRSAVGGQTGGNVSLQVGSHNLRDMRAGLEAGGDAWGLRLNAQRYETDNYRRNNQARVNSADAELRIGDHRGFVALALNADDQKARLPGPRREEELSADRRGTNTPLDYLNSRSQRVALLSERQFDDLTLALDVSNRQRRSKSLFDDRGVWGFYTSTANTDVDVTSLSPRVSWQVTSSGWDNMLTFGADWSEWDYRRNAANSYSWFPFFDERNERGQQKNVAYYLRNEVRFDSGTRVSFGARSESVKQVLLGVTAKPKETKRNRLAAYEIALQQELGIGYNVYARIGRSYRLANIDENRCDFPPFCGEVLKPQQSRDSELGLQWSGSASSLRASIFDINLKNEIHFMAIGILPDRISQNINLPPTRRRGLELEGSVFLSNSIDIATNYTFTRAAFRKGSFAGIDVTGNTVPMVPRHRLGLNLGWQVTEATRATLNMVYVGSQLYDNDQANRFRRMPSYAIADVVLSHRVGTWRFAAGVNNVFDKKYYSYGIVNGTYTSFNAYPEDRRNAYLRAEYRF